MLTTSRSKIDLKLASRFLSGLDGFNPAPFNRAEELAGIRRIHLEAHGGQTASPEASFVIDRPRLLSEPYATLARQIRSAFQEMLRQYRVIDPEVLDRKFLAPAREAVKASFVRGDLDTNLKVYEVGLTLSRSLVSSLPARAKELDKKVRLPAGLAVRL